MVKNNDIIRQNNRAWRDKKKSMATETQDFRRKSAGERYRAIIQAATEGFGLLDARGRFIDVNEAYCSLTGYSRDELLRMSIADVEAVEGPEDVERHIKKAVEAGHDRFETRHRCKDGAVLNIEVSVNYLDEDGGLLFTFLHDVTERKRRAEETIGGSEERYRMLHSTAFDGIIIADSSGRITESNPSAEKMFGYGKGDLSGREIVELMPERYRAAHAAGFRRFIETGESRSRGKVLEFVGLKKDGTSFPIELLIGSFEVNGRVCFTGTFRDITERKSLEAEVLKTQKLESLGVLAGGIAHNFNNIMTGILGSIFLAKGSVAGGDALKRLEEAERGIELAKDLTRRLLTFSMGGSPVKKTASVAELVTESADFVLSGTMVRSEYSIPDGLWAIEADAGLISQVIRNLVMNAVQAMPDGGVVKVSCENAEVSGADSPLKDGRYVKITVEDSGVGIPHEDLQRVFDPYFTTKEDGTGLGLSASYSIIKNHEGHISVESTPGKGSVFFVYLPASQTTGPEAVKKPSAVVNGAGMVLVMDDEEVVRNTAGGILDVLGYTAAYAKDGAEAIEAYIEARAKEEPFDAVIMDLTVPGGMGGKEAIARLLLIDPSVKAIVSSGYSNDPVMSEFAKFGFKAVIPKPYSVAEFSATISKVIKGG